MFKLNNVVDLKCVMLFILYFVLMACSDTKKASQSPKEVPVELYSLSGNIIIPLGSGVDNDVQKDGFTPLNNNFDNAQQISNPSFLGGYLSGTSGFYSTNDIDSENAYTADPADIFQVSLLAGQSISLNVFYADNGDFATSDMRVGFRLFSSSNTISALSENILNEAGVSSIQIPQSDDYYIVISADSNNTVPLLYTLSVSQDISNSASTNRFKQVSPNEQFVPGEVIIKYKANPESVNSQAAVAKTASALKMTTKKKLGKLGYLKKLDLNDTKMAALSSTSSVFASSGFSSAQFNALPKKYREKWQTASLINQLKQDPNVEYAEPNYLRAASYVPSDPKYSNQWHYPLINLPAAWEVSTGSGVTVAVIDTGIASGHVDLDDNIDSANGWDFISNISSAGDGNGQDNNPEDVAGSFHGSHVAGIIAAEEGNNQGIVGAAFNAKIMPLRVLGIDGFGSDSDISQAILYAAGLSNSSGRSSKADIINLSLGSEAFSNSLRNAINAALSEGVIVIAAAGNNASSVPFYPAAFDGVVSVSAVSETKTLASFSNYGSTIDVAAPGGSGINDLNNDHYRDGILSTVYASYYEELQGTSMAAPHVAGVAALMKSIDSTLDSTKFSLALSSGEITDNIGSASFFGAGLINAAKAMAWVGQTVSSQLISSPGSVSFIGESTQSTLSLSNPGEGNSVLVESISEEVSWLSVESNIVNEQLLGTYIIKIDRSDLSEGSNYSTTISINYRIDGGDLLSYSIPVFLAVPDAVSTATVGTVFAFLTRKADQDAAEENNDPFVDIYAVANTSYSDGQYQFNFSNVPKGQYILDASTDNDNDFIVSDQGEAVGAYPLMSESVIITVGDQNITGLDFSMSYPALSRSSLNLLEKDLQKKKMSRLPQTLSNKQAKNVRMKR